CVLAGGVRGIPILPAHLWLAGINHNYVDGYAWLILDWNCQIYFQPADKTPVPTTGGLKT
ncbi:hypothetical protein ACR46R_005224, partial [Escherichia coli]